MALSQSALSELLDAIRAGGSEDVLREAMTLVLQELIELEAAQAIGAGRYERTDERTTHRNGSRSRLLSTKAGDVELRTPSSGRGRSSCTNPTIPLRTTMARIMIVSFRSPSSAVIRPATIRTTIIALVNCSTSRPKAVFCHARRARYRRSGRVLPQPPSAPSRVPDAKRVRRRLPWLCAPTVVQ